MWGGPTQYTDPSGRFMMLPTDIAIKTDPSFRVHLERFAVDAEAFNVEFGAAFAKLLALGCPAACQPAEECASGASCPHAKKEAKRSAGPAAEFREHAMHGSLEHCEGIVKRNGAASVAHGLEANSGAYVHVMHADCSALRVFSLSLSLWLRACFCVLSHPLPLLFSVSLSLPPTCPLRTHTGRTALMKACFWGHEHMLPFLIETCRCRINVQDYHGDTAMHDAARFGHLGIVQALLAAGGDVTLKNAEGQDVAAVAEAYLKPHVVSFIRSKL